MLEEKGMEYGGIFHKLAYAKTHIFTYNRKAMPSPSHLGTNFSLQWLADSTPGMIMHDLWWESGGGSNFSHCLTSKYFPVMIMYISHQILNLLNESEGKNIKNNLPTV